MFVKHYILACLPIYSMMLKGFRRELMSYETALRKPGPLTLHERYDELSVRVSANSIAARQRNNTNFQLPSYSQKKNV